MTLEQPVAQIGHRRVVGLVGTVGGLKDPPADEIVVDQADPVAESVHLLRGCHAPCVMGLDLLACACPTGEVAHHLGIRVERDLPLEVLIGEWHQGEPLRVQGLLRDASDHAALLQLRRHARGGQPHVEVGLSGWLSVRAAAIVSG